MIDDSNPEVNRRSGWSPGHTPVLAKREEPVYPLGCLPVHRRRDVRVGAERALE